MSKKEPVVLELASLPRDQMGPFLILGLEKSAPKEEVDKHWAERIKWAHRKLINVPREDINWARESLNDLDKRLKADAASLNADTADGLVASLAQRYGADSGQVSRLWQPLDVEKPLADYTPAAEVPDLAQVREGITLPTLPEETLAGLSLLEALAKQPLDPWSVTL